MGNTNNEIPGQARDDILKLQKQIQGEVVYDEETLKIYSHDTSVFEIKPLAVVYPKNSLDIAHIVKFVQDNKFTIPHLAITPRSGGSDMTGGAIGQGLIVDVTRYMNAFELVADLKFAQIQPGVFYRDFEPKSLEHALLMPVYPASKDLAAFGGMISNNCAGEKSIQYGQMRNFVESIKVILANGQEYEFKEISFGDVEQIIKGKDEFIAGIYRRIFHLIEQNYDFIQHAKPKTTKNSSGYALWDVMNKDKKTFNLAQLIVGAQGTLGVVVDSRIRLITEKPFKKIITVFLPTWNILPKIVNIILPHNPESLEVFDDTTLKLGLRFFPQIAKRINKTLLSFAFDFIPEFFIGIRMFGLPKLIMIVELSADTEEDLKQKTLQIETSLKNEKVIFRVIPSLKEAEKYFVVRRESFNLLRNEVKGKSTVPFIEDFCIDPKKLPQFLPELLSILKKNKININIVGHAGEGNLHIIPLMNLKDPKERAKILPVAKQVYSLIIAYGGTITAEHNDGIIRTPFIKEMFGERMTLLFKEVKGIFDMNNIFNPGKKVGGTFEDIERWMKRK
jgi:FAD/FMN-containing dehydrogenase